MNYNPNVWMTCDDAWEDEGDRKVCATCGFAAYSQEEMDEHNEKKEAN